MHSDTQDLEQHSSSDLISAEKVRGTAVYGADNEKIGSIDSVMLTKRGGKVAYAILSFGGFLGIGEKYHPLPWGELDYDTSLGGYRVHIARERLLDAPAYARDEIDRDDWSGATDGYYTRADDVPVRSYSASDRI